MESVNLQTLKTNGITDVFLNYYALTVHGENKVLSFIENANKNNINVHIWMQCFYDGEWHNPKTTDLTNRFNEAKKYANMKGVYGVHLDYVRYPGNAYKTDGGADAITKFVKTIREQNPNVFLSCAIMPESDIKYYYGQDLDALGKIVNAVLPMQYKGNYGLGTDWLASTSKMFSKKATIWSGLQSYKSDDNTKPLSETELLNDAKTCLNNGAEGIIMFRYGLSPNINFSQLAKTSDTVVSNGDNVNKISNKNIFNLAKAVKESVEKNKKFPSSIKIDNVEYSNSQIAYILSYAINNLKSDIEILTPKAPSSFSNGDAIKENISPSDLKDQAKRITQYIKQYGQIPLYATTVTSKKKASVQMFTYAFAKTLVWYQNNNNTWPNYTTYDTSIFSGTTSTTTSTPVSTKTKILNKDIYTLAKNVKAGVEKNKKLDSSFGIGNVSYTNAEVPYILSYAINNLKSDCTIPSGIKAPSTFTNGNSINEDIYPDDLKDQAKRIVEYIKKNGQVPVYVTTVKSKKQVSVQMFTYAFAKTLVWYSNNKSVLPNYTNYNTSVFSTNTTSTVSTSTSTTSSSTTSTNGLYAYITSQGCSGMGQCTGYYCACNSLQQCFYRLTGIKVAESTIASVAGTTTAGTDHQGINTAVAWFNKKYNKNIKITWKSFSDLGSSTDARWKALQSYIDKGAVFCHLLYRNKYGHYEVPKSVGSSSLQILNSLGDKCSSPAYCGYIETRSKSNQLSYINGISQKSIAILTK